MSSAEKVKRAIIKFSKNYPRVVWEAVPHRIGKFRKRPCSEGVMRKLQTDCHEILSKNEHVGGNYLFLEGGDNMKKKWQKPKLEVLDVNMTMGHAEQMEHLDHTYETGTPYSELSWS